MSVRMKLSLDRQCELVGLPKPEAEIKFHPVRRWRFDWGFRQQLLAVEIEGGAFVGGRHTRGAGFLKDMEKYNAAALLGWRILRFTPKQVTSGEAVNVLTEALK